MTKEQDEIVKQFVKDLLDAHYLVMVSEFGNWGAGTTLRQVIADVAEHQHYELFNNKEEQDKVVSAVCEYLGASPELAGDSWYGIFQRRP